MASHLKTFYTSEEYLILEHEADTRSEYCNRWTLSETNRLDETIQLNSIGCRLSPVDIYRKVNISAE
jgi:hypothetical protein